MSLVSKRALILRKRMKQSFPFFILRKYISNSGQIYDVLSKKKVISLLFNLMPFDIFLEPVQKQFDSRTQGTLARFLSVQDLISYS